MAHAHQTQPQVAHDTLWHMLRACVTSWSPSSLKQFAAPLSALTEDRYCSDIARLQLRARIALDDGSVADTTVGARGGEAKLLILSNEAISNCGDQSRAG